MVEETSETADTANESAAGRVDAIYIASGPKPTPMALVDEVDAVAGRGLRGDRYFHERGTYDTKDHLEPSDITLVEAEAIEAAERDYDVSIPPGGTRRNVVTRNVPLNHLVDHEFAVGGARCRGIALCEPCLPMQKDAAVEGMVEALVHRGGLDAEIIESGTITEGDEIRY
jgi:MOSC domain-containing protein YiiM